MRVFRSSPQFGVTLVAYELLHRTLPPSDKTSAPVLYVIYDMIWYNVIWYDTMWYDKIRCCIVRYYALVPPSYTLLYSTMLYHITILYYTLLYCDIILQPTNAPLTPSDWDQFKSTHISQRLDDLENLTHSLDLSVMDSRPKHWFDVMWHEPLFNYA